MKQYFCKSLSLILAFQFALGPMAYAQDAATVISGSLQAINQALSTQQVANEDALVQSRTLMLESQLDPRVCATSGGCTDTIFPTCKILNRVPNMVEPEICQSEFNVNVNPAGVAQARIELQAYVNTFGDIATKYETWAKTSTQATNEGLSCLEQSATRLDQDLAAAEKKVQDLIDQITKAKTEFQAATASTLAGIQEGQALLYGTSQGGTKSAAILTENSVKFADLFPAACKTIMTNTEFDTNGRSGGLMSLQTKLYDKASENVQMGSGTINALSFDSAKANDITAKIRDIASRAGSAVTSGGLNALGNSTSGITDTYGLLSEANDALKDVQKDADTFKADLQNNQSTATNSQVQIPDSILYGQNNSNFEQALNSAERTIKNNCFRTNGNAMSELLAGKMAFVIPGFNQSGSSKRSANTFQTDVLNVLRSDSYTIEEKLSLIQNSEKQGTNSQYQLQMPDSITGPNFAYDKGDYVTVSQFVSNYVQACQAQFNATNGEKASPAATIAQMRTLRGKYTAYVSSLPTKISNAITNRMINCVDGSTASATGAATCSANALSTANSTFCVARAVTCSNNMRSCYDLAQKQVTAKTQQRDQYVTAYKARTAVAKSALQGLYEKVKTIAKTQSDAISRIPGSASLDIPADAKSLFNYNPRALGQNYIQGLESLEVEDPEVFYTNASENLRKIKEALKKQRDTVFKGGDQSSSSELAGGINKHIDKVRKDMTDEAQNIRQNYLRKCQQTLNRLKSDSDRYDNQVAELTNKRNNDLNNLCSNYNAVMTAGQCSDSLISLAESAETAAQSAMASGSREATRIRALRSHCERIQSEANDTTDVPETTVIDRFRRNNRCTGNNPPTGCDDVIALDSCTYRSGTAPTTTVQQNAFSRELPLAYVSFLLNSQNEGIRTNCSRFRTTASTNSPGPSDLRGSALTSRSNGSIPSGEDGNACRNAINAYLWASNSGCPANSFEFTDRSSPYKMNLSKSISAITSRGATDDDLRAYASNLGEVGTSACAAQNQGLSIGNLGQMGIPTGNNGAAQDPSSY